MAHTQEALRRLAAKLPRNLVIFDGVCYYCNHNVQFALKNNFQWDKDSANILHFSPQQSTDAQYVASHFQNLLRGHDTIILLERRPNKKKNKVKAWINESSKYGAGSDDDIHVYIKSRAVFRIGMKLDHPVYRWASTFAYYCLPKFITDYFYDSKAEKRYLTYGKSNGCIVPTEEMKARLWTLKRYPAYCRLLPFH